jgi:hypothetical protein
LLCAFASRAQANEAEVFCSKVSLSPGTTCWSVQFRFALEVEGWSEKGTAACIGVGTGSGNGTSSWYVHVCEEKSAAPPNEIYCLEACEGVSGHGFVHDHSGTTSDKFTGWWYFT